jgi:hypothetical protein
MSQLVFDDDLANQLETLYRTGDVLRRRRLVVWDVDWSTVSWHSADPDRMRRVLAIWDGHLADPCLPRTLAAGLRSVGFGDIAAIRGRPGAFPEFYRRHVARVTGMGYGGSTAPRTWPTS